MRAGRRVSGAIGAALLMAACSGGAPLAVVASSGGSIGVGEQRVLLAVVDPETQAFLADQGSDASATLRDDNGTPIGTYDLEFVWTVPGVRGIYVGHFDIPEAGVYQVSVSQEGYAESGPTGFLASEDPVMVAPGDPAPASETRTGSDVADLALITSDPTPDPDLYEMTVAEAVGNGRPTLLVFATPAFCSTQTCGPMLSQVKDLKFEYPEIDFVHVEIYEDLQVESLEDLMVVDAVLEWGLPSEPWVYIVDSGGIVVAAFEGAVNDGELTSILDGLAGR